MRGQVHACCARACCKQAADALRCCCCFLVQVVDLVQTLDGGRRNMYDPDEIEEEQREREKRNKINADFNQFVRRVQVGRGLCLRIKLICLMSHASAADSTRCLPLLHSLTHHACAAAVCAAFAFFAPGALGAGVP